MTTPHTARPEAPQFYLRHLGWVAYAMSVSTGGVGQVLFLGHAFGGHAWSYIAAVGLAAFAEVVMAASGDKSLDHRANRRTWLPLLVLGIAVSCYAASMNVVHFIQDNPALAWTFGGASLVGFLLHVIDGHIRVDAYLRDLDEYRTGQATPVTAPEPVATPKTPAPRPTPKPAAAAPVTMTPSPGAAAATTFAPAPAPKPVVQPENVRELRPAKTKVARIDIEEVYAWFAAEVDRNGGDPMKVSGPAIDEQFGTNDYLKKQIKPFRERYARENLTAVNQ